MMPNMNDLNHAAAMKTALGVKETIDAGLGKFTNPDQPSLVCVSACYLDLTARYKKLLELAKGLVDRVDRIGGLGEYKGGVPFCLGDLRNLFEEERKLK